MSSEKQPAIVMPDNLEKHDIVRREHIPPALTAYPQWVCWRYVARGKGKKPDKRPLNPHNLHNAGVHWPNTWSGFEQAYATYTTHLASGIAGIGFVLTPEDPFVGIDIDHCIAGEEISPDAQTVVDYLHSYTEVSPSGAGLRLLVVCPEFQANARRPELEVYAHDRFLTLTGHHLDGTPTEIAAVTAAHLQALLPQRRRYGKSLDHP